MQTTIYPILLVRLNHEHGYEEQRFVSQEVFSRRKELPKGLNAILKKISSAQPSGLSDMQVLEYFRGNMGKQGFKSVELSHGMIVNEAFTYQFR